MSALATLQHPKRLLCLMRPSYLPRGHYLSPERLLQISRDVPKVAILTGDLDEIIDPQRSRDLERFLPVSLMAQLALSARCADSGPSALHFKGQPVCAFRGRRPVSHIIDYLSNMRQR